MDVHLRFASDDVREKVLPMLRQMLPAEELIVTEDGALIRLEDAVDERAAIVYAQTKKNWACDQTGINRESVTIKVGGWP